MKIDPHIKGFLIEDVLRYELGRDRFITVTVRKEEFEIEYWDKHDWYQTDIINIEEFYKLGLCL